MTTVGSDSRSVLVVEDDPTTCELIAELLTEEGFRVLQTGSGSVGLEPWIAFTAAILNDWIDEG